MNIASNLKGGPPYKPGVADLVKARTRDQVQDPNVHCMPRGAPRIWTDDYYKRIIQTPERLIILTERNIQYRQIFTRWAASSGGSEPDLERLFHGEVGRRHAGGPNHRVPRRLWLDANGNPLSNTGKTTEKIRRPNFGTLQIEITIDDPKYYTAPWTIR